MKRRAASLVMALALVGACGSKGNDHAEGGDSGLDVVSSRDASPNDSVADVDTGALSLVVDAPLDLAETSSTGGTGATGVDGSSETGSDAAADRASDGAGEGEGCIGVCGGGTCAGRECAATVPVGWMGPFQITGGPGISNGLTCPGGAQPVFEGHILASTEMVTCSACECAPPSGMDCEVEMNAWTMNGCLGTSTLVTIGESCGDGPTGAPGVTQSLSFSGGYVPSVFCSDPMPGSGNPLDSPSEWQDDYIGCSPSTSAGSCIGGVCVTPSDSPFSPQLCVVHSDDIDCPATYTSKTLYYTGAADTRDCGTCACLPGGDLTCSNDALDTFATCPPTTGLYNASGPPIASATGCVPDLPSYNFAALGNVSFSGSAMCMPSGGLPTGAVTPEGPVTVCCIPAISDGGIGDSGV